MEAAGLFGAHSVCLDQPSLALVEVNVLEDCWALGSVLAAPSLMVFSSEINELVKSSDVEFD